MLENKNGSSFDVEVAYEQLWSDLKTLTSRIYVHNRPCNEGDVRVASVILRRWLNENVLGRLANELGVKATLTVLDNQRLIDAVSNDPTIIYFLTGGIKFDGRAMMGIYESTADFTGNHRLPLVGGLQQIHVSPSAMLKQKRVFFDGEFFSCREIIGFVDNKLGGAHLDFKRDSRGVKLASASNYMTFGGPLDKIGRSPPGKLYYDLEPNGIEILSGFHIEVIAAAASLISFRLDDQPLMSFEIKPTIKEKLRGLLGIKRKRRTNLLGLRISSDI